MAGRRISVASYGETGGGVIFRESVCVNRLAPHPGQPEASRGWPFLSRQSENRWRGQYSESTGWRKYWRTITAKATARVSKANENGERRGAQLEGGRKKASESARKREMLAIMPKKYRQSGGKIWLGWRPKAINQLA